jgi:hypothetical protein
MRRRGGAVSWASASVSSASLAVARDQGSPPDRMTLVDVRVGADQFDRLPPVARSGGFGGVVEVAAEAVAAVDRTTAGGDQQGAATVFADHAIGGLGRTVADRVQAEAGPGCISSSSGAPGATADRRDRHAASSRRSRAAPAAGTGPPPRPRLSVQPIRGPAAPGVRAGRGWPRATVAASRGHGLGRGALSEGRGNGYHVGSRFSGAADLAQQSPTF